MKNELSIVLFSRHILTEQMARKQILALSEFQDGLMRPDKFGEYEPITTPFDPTDIIEPVRLLSKTHGSFLYRKGRPCHVAGEIWNRTNPPTARFPSPRFSNYWTGRCDGKWSANIGTRIIKDFVSDIFPTTGSDFAFLTPEVDLTAKNTDDTMYSYQGLDLFLGVPGLYWINFFSDELANWLRLNDLPSDLAQLTPVPLGGVCLKFCESPEDCRTVEVIQRQLTAINWLGSERFFNILVPGRKLKFPDWTSVQ